MTPSPAAMPPGVVRGPGEGNLDRLSIDIPACTAEIYLHGAHVTAWQPRGTKPVIWMSGSSRFEAGRPIRGGIPICFPWFGPRPSHPGSPPHGFARLSTWTLDGVARRGDCVKVALTLQTGSGPGEPWPHRCTLAYHVEFGSTLAVELVVRNDGSARCTFEEALHTYFSVGDVREATVEGLAGATYVDKMRGGDRFVQDAAPIGFAGETDRVYVDTRDTATIVDAAWQRRIVVEKQGSRSTVVWNPWIAKANAMPDFGEDEWPTMLCVETGNALDDAVQLPPGSEHRLRTAIRVE